MKTHRIFKDGKAHIYYSLCESLRVNRKRVLQRQVLHLGELNTPSLSAGSERSKWSKKMGGVFRCDFSVIGTARWRRRRLPRM